MNFKSLFIFPVTVGFLINLHAQQTWTGKMHAKETTDIKISRFYNSIDNSTKYIITKNFREIFEINFRYEENSILIFWIDREKLVIDSHLLKFSEGDKKILISNYQPNVPIIDESPENLILFSTEKESSVITLYQFKPFNGCPFYFELQAVPENIRAQHLQEMNDYSKEQLTQRNRIITIEKLKEDIRNYKDTLIYRCHQKKNAEIKNSQAFAEGELKAIFSARLDSIIRARFENLILFTGDDDFNIKCEFYCDENKMVTVDTTKKGFYFTDGRVRTWFRDSFFLYAKPTIEKLTFSTGWKTLENPDLLTNLNKQFKLRIDELDPGHKEQIFDEDLKLAEAELRDYLQYDINVPVRYAYDIKVKSETKFPEWRYNASGEIVNKSEGVNKVEITNDITRQFKALNLETGARYSIEYCTVFINEKRLRPHIRKITPRAF